MIHASGATLAVLCAAMLAVQGLRLRHALDINRTLAARAVLFDAGNGYLRQGIRESADSSRSVAFIELAKQRYRDVLDLDPMDWDARFNLERALRLAPEEREAFEQPEDRPIERPPDNVPEMLAPDLP